MMISRQVKEAAIARYVELFGPTGVSAAELRGDAVAFLIEVENRWPISDQMSWSSRRNC